MLDLLFQSPSTAVVVLHAVYGLGIVCHDVTEGAPLLYCCWKPTLPMLGDPTALPTHRGEHRKPLRLLLLIFFAAPSTIRTPFQRAVEQANFPFNGTGPGRHSGDEVERAQGARQRGANGRHG